MFLRRRNIIFGRPLCQGAPLDRVKRAFKNKNLISFLFVTGKLLSQSLARPFGQGGDLLPPSLFWGSQNQTFVNTQISRRFSRNVYKLFPGTCPLLFRGAWRLPGVLPPPCSRQPCPSAWPLQVFSSPCPFPSSLPSFLLGTF